MRDEAIRLERFLFQSTCLREARPSDSPTTCGGASHFNPRAYVRHDAAGGEGRGGCGGDFNPRAYVRHDSYGLFDAADKLFQSTCLREARPAGREPSHMSANFNPRAYVRHDLLFGLLFDNLDISIHVPT